MAKYSLHCGDTEIVRVYFKAETPQALSKDEQEKIREKARETNEYKNFQDWIGFGFMTIKLCL